MSQQNGFTLLDVLIASSLASLGLLTALSLQLTLERSDAHTAAAFAAGLLAEAQLETARFNALDGHRPAPAASTAIHRGRRYAVTLWLDDDNVGTNATVDVGWTQPNGEHAVVRRTMSWTPNSEKR